MKININLCFDTCCCCFVITGKFCDCDGSDSSMPIRDPMREACEKLANCVSSLIGGGAAATLKFLLCEVKVSFIEWVSLADCSAAPRITIFVKLDLFGSKRNLNLCLRLWWWLAWLLALLARLVDRCFEDLSNGYKDDSKFITLF